MSGHRGGRGARCGSEPARPAPRGPVGRGKERGAGPKFLLELRLRGQVYREAPDWQVVTIPRPCAGCLRLSREVGTGTWDPVPDVSLWGTLPSFHRLIGWVFLLPFPPPPNLSFLICALGVPRPPPFLLLLWSGHGIEPQGHNPQPSAALFKEIALSIYTGTSKDGALWSWGLRDGGLEGEGRGP